MTLRTSSCRSSYIVRDFELGLLFQPRIFFFFFIRVFYKRPVKESNVVIAVENGQGLPFQCGVIERALPISVAPHNGDIRTTNAGKNPSDEGRCRAHSSI